MNNKSLYIHIPFCSYICDYCDFTKLQYFSSFVSPYLDALEEELKSYSIEKLETIYVGGGTPTSLNVDELERLLKIIKPYLKGVKEYTFEANPDSLTIDKLMLLHRYHVNRLSIGVESTDDNVLKSINRHHTFNDVKQVIKDAREIGFTNINIDLILGLPHVSKSMIKKDILNIIDLGVEHISCYSLTINKNTKFAIDGVTELDDNIAREYYDEVSTILDNNGYVHYEISNYAKPGYYSLHNLTYWKDEHYFGIGLGASGYIDNIRYTNTKNLRKYINRQFERNEEEISLVDDREYYIFLNLRTIFGLSFDDFKAKFGVDLYQNRKIEIENFISQGYLFIEKNTLKPTYNGMMILDRIVLKLFL